MLLFYDLKSPKFPGDTTLLLLLWYNSKAISKFTLVIYSVLTKGDKVDQKSLQSVKTVAQFRQINSN